MTEQSVGDFPICKEPAYTDNYYTPHRTPWRQDEPRYPLPPITPLVPSIPYDRDMFQEQRLRATIAALEMENAKLKQKLEEKQEKFTVDKAINIAQKINTELESRIVDSVNYNEKNNMITVKFNEISLHAELSFPLTKEVQLKIELNRPVLIDILEEE